MYHAGRGLVRLFVFVSVLYLYRWEFMPRFFPGSCAAVFFSRRFLQIAPHRELAAHCPHFFPRLPADFSPAAALPFFSPEQSALCSLGFSPLKHNKMERISNGPH